jgi:hypothetical protein
VEQEFLKPILDGDRFRDHRVPLEVLKDFAALQEMLIEVAKWKFRQEHPQRERVQRNFTKDIELQLAGVEEGSAKLVIVLAFSTLFPPANVKYFEQARTEVVNAIEQSAQGRMPSLPPRFLTYFDSFGRSLRADETIGFASEGGTVKLDTTVRKKLVLASKVETWTEEVGLRARIWDADVLHNSFQFELSDGVRAKAPLDDRSKDAVLDALKGYKDGAYVLIQGVVQRDRRDRIKGFESIEHVTPLDPLDTRLRLNQFATLEDGWLNGKGKAPAKENLEWLAEAFESDFDSDLPLPYLFPTAEGGVQAEWNLKDWAVTLDIDLNSRKAEYQALNLKDLSSKDLELALGDDVGWKTLNDELKQLDAAQVEADKRDS